MGAGGRSDLEAPKFPLTPGPLHLLFPCPETFAPINSHTSSQEVPSSRKPSLILSWVRCSPPQPPGSPIAALTSAGLSLSVTLGPGGTGLPCQSLHRELPSVGTWVGIPTPRFEERPGQVWATRGASLFSCEMCKEPLVPPRLPRAVAGHRGDETLKSSADHMPGDCG